MAFEDVVAFYQEAKRRAERKEEQTARSLGRGLYADKDLEEARQNILRGGRSEQESIDDLKRYLQDISRAKEFERKDISRLEGLASGSDLSSEDLAARLESRALSRGISEQGARAGSLAGNPLAAQRAAGAAGIAGRERDAAARGIADEAAQKRALLGEILASAQRDEGISRQLERAQLSQDATIANRALTDQMRALDFARTQEQLRRSKKASRNSFLQGMLGSAVSGAGAGVAMGLLSDERSKKGVKDAGKTLDIILEKVKPVEFEYVEESGSSRMMPEGRFAGIMAQDLEDAGLDGMVLEGVRGEKLVDLPSMVPLLLASQARLSERLNELEGEETPTRRRRKRNG